VDPIKSLLNGSQEPIAEDTLNCLHTAGTRRFILMSGCGVSLGTPVENLVTMVKTAKNYRPGPANLIEVGEK
jgi:uroporphyrinogen-III decarboxylase